MVNRFGTGSITGKFKNPYQFSAGRVSSDTSNALYEAIKSQNRSRFELEEERSMLDRTFDALQVGNYTTANYASDWVKLFKGDEDASFIKAINPFDDVMSGIRAANPFGSGSGEDEKTFSGVIEDMGWKPKSLLGRITKGTLGFAGDILLDPLTYLSGGTSAIVKGTGRTGMAVKTLADVATKYNDGVKLTHMTEDVARKIIKESDTFNKLSPSSDELAESAKKFADNFNKQLGIRDVNPRPVTFGVSNLPFGDKLAPKLGVLGRTMELSDGQSLRKIADVIGTGKAYSGIRNSIYGSRIGEKLSTNSPLFKVAHSNPSQLYEMMVFGDSVKGMNLSKIEAEKMIYAKAKELGTLSKADAKEIVDLLQDKTAFAPIKGILKFAETKKAQEMKRSLHGHKADLMETQDKMVTLRNLNHEIEVLKSTGKGADEVVVLEKRFSSALKSMDEVTLRKNMQADSELRKMLETRIKESKTAVWDIDSSLLKGAKGEALVKQLAKMANSVVDETQLANTARQLGKQANTKSVMVDVDGKTGRGKKVVEGANKYKQQSANISLNERAKMNEALSEVAFGHGNAFNLGSAPRIVDDSLPVLQNMMKFKSVEQSGNIPKFIEENPGFFGHRLNLNQQSRYSDMLQRGDFEGLFHDYLARNPQVINDHAKDVYKYLAKKYGYKSFHEDVLAPLDKLRAKQELEPQNMTPKELVRMEDLLSKVAGRTTDFKKYFKDMDDKSFKELRKVEEHTARLADYEDMLAKDSGVYDKPDTELVVPKNQTDMYGHQVGDKVGGGKEGSPLDPRGELSGTLKYAQKDWDVFTEANGARYHYNHQDYLHKETGEMIRAGTRHKRGQTSIEPMPNYKDPTPAPIKVDAVKKELTSTDLLKGKSGEAIRNRVEARLAELFINKSGGLADVAKHLSKNKWRVEKLSKVVAEVMVQKHPGKVLTDLDSEVEIKDVIRMATRLSAELRKEITPADVRKALGKEEETLKVLKKAESLKTIGEDLVPGRTVRIDKDGEKLQGAITSVRKGENDTHIYTMRNGEDYIDFNVNQVVAIPAHIKLKTMRQVMEEDEVVKSLIETRVTAQKELDALADPKKFTPEQQKARDEFTQAEQQKINKVKEQAESMERYASKARELMEEYFGKETDDILNAIQPDAKADDIAKVFETRVNNLSKKIAEIDDALKSDEAFEFFAKDAYGDDIVAKTIDAENMEHANMRPAIDDMASNEQVRHHVKYLRETFNKIGQAEVGFEKLTAKQFDAMYDHYLPHVPTEAGQRYFATQKEIKEHASMITADYGYGMKWNPFAKSRTIEGKNIDEINEKFREHLKGENLFSTEISKIYTARMLKHEELRYDQEFMVKMMDMFGSDIGEEGVKEGYKAVANYGMLRKFFTNEAKTSMSARMRAERRNGRTVEFTKEERMQLFEEEVGKAVKKYGFKPGVLDNHATPMVELTKEQTALLNKLDKSQIQKLGADGLAKQVSQPIVERANRARKLAIAKDESRALQLYDKFLHFMKINQTSIMPSFHIRNKASNDFANWLAIGRETFDPKMQLLAHKASFWMNNPEKLATLPPIVSADKTKVYRIEDIVTEALARDGMQEGFFAKDIGAGAVSSGLFKNTIPGKFNPTDTGNFIPYKVGTAFGSNIENASRFLHIATLLKHGKSMDEAVESSIKYLFDYSDLTSFEQSVMKRIFPYYTWMRKNVRLQYSELIEQPNKYALIPKLENWIEGMSNEDERVEERYTQDFARDWVQTPFGINNKEGKREPLMMNPNLPFMDLANVVDPFNLKDSAREFFSQTAPMIKVPVEQALNKNMFFDSPIVREGESGLGKRAQHLAGQFAAFNAYNGATKGDDANNALHLMGSLTGLKLTAYNYEDSKRRVLEEAYANPTSDGFIYSIVDSVSELAKGALSISGEVISDGILNAYGRPPKSADAYTGALSPISSHEYDKLSADEKKKYTEPTKEDVNAYHRRAVELSEQAFNESGKVKKFMWTLLEKIDPPEKRQMGYVTKVADGDTFTVRVGDYEKSVRLLLVDTPETVDPRLDGPQPMGKEASDYTKSMLFGKDVSLIIDGEDKYGRTLAFVELDGNDYNKKLLEEGLGKVRYLFGRDDAKVDDYFNTEIEASKNKKGIWSIPDYSLPGVDTGFSQR